MNHPLSPSGGEGQGEGGHRGPRDDPSAPLADRWRAAVEEVEKVSALAAPALKQAALLWIRDGEVGVSLPPGMFATTVERRRADVEAVLARFFGKPTRLTVALGAAASQQPQADAPPAASLAQTEAAERQARSARVRDAARGHPNIREAAKILEGDVDGIEEL